MVEDVGAGVIKPGSLAGLLSEQELVERVMTLHWDMAACRCKVCEYGNDKGWRPQEQYLPHRLPRRV